MKVSKKHIAVGMLALGLITTAGAGVTAAAGDNTHGHFAKRGGSEVIANLIGISEDDFRTRVENGENPKDILEAAGITKEDVQVAHEQALQERLAQAVADGRLTQEEADERIAHQAERKALMEATRVAIENNDYQAWATAVSGTPMAEKVDATTFSKLVEAHNLRESGDHEGARAIMEELGLKGPHGPHHGQRGSSHE